MTDRDYEAWRPALAAYYERQCSFQSAENVRHGFALTFGDKREIDALKAALAARPEWMEAA